MENGRDWINSPSRTVAVVLICAAGVFFPSVGSSLAQGTLTDDEIKAAIIQQSIAEYPGNCPCPYNRASNGSKCGKRSAWSKAGGYAPICYPEEVTPEMMRQFRASYSG